MPLPGPRWTRWNPFTGSPEPPTAISLDEAVELTRTGDAWVFRGRSAPDRAIRLVTNAPVNHVAMAVVLSDLPPLMWHAELGQALPDMWTGDHHRGVQLHDLRDAVLRWTGVYKQKAYLRQLHPAVDRDQEDALLKAIARYNGMSFPTNAQLAWRWVRGRGGVLSWLPQRPIPHRDMILRPDTWPGVEVWRGSDIWPVSGVPRGRDFWRGRGLWRGQRARRADPRQTDPRHADLAHADPVDAPTDPRVRRPEAAYCAEVVALTYEAMGILERGRPANWYDPGRFWSGDELPLVPGWVFGPEIRVRPPAATP